MIEQEFDEFLMDSSASVSRVSWTPTRFMTPQKQIKRPHLDSSDSQSTAEGSNFASQSPIKSSIDEYFEDEAFCESSFGTKEESNSRCIRTLELDRKGLQNLNLHIPREYNSCRFIPSKRKSNYNSLLINTETNFKSHSKNGESLESNQPSFRRPRRNSSNDLFSVPEAANAAEIDVGDSATQMLIKMYKSELLQIPNINENDASTSRMLKFCENRSVSNPMNLMKSSPSSSLDFSFTNEANRRIPKTPYKVLDAPALQDDFYLNLIDWAPSDTLAVGLSSSVYLWSALTSKVTKLCDNGPIDTVSSVSWSSNSSISSLLAVGTNSGEIQMWDSEKLKKVRTLSGHKSRVGTIAWNTNLIASGSRDKSILVKDIRVKEGVASKLTGHKQEVCGLKWSFDGNQLSSGGNDNRLFVWSTHSTVPVVKFTNHTAAVKALAWSPHQHGLLASGGGTADKTIRFWNTLQGTQVDCIDTGSQVCNLIFSKNLNEIVSTHGYSLNQVVLWRYPSMKKMATLSGHTYRVLYLAISPDGQTIVTGAGDETLRFWNVFPSKESTNNNSSSKLSPSVGDMR